jgi:calpain-7
MSNINRKAAQANTRLAHALDLDENSQKQEAIDAYMEASELYLEAIKMADNEGSGLQSVASLLKRRLTGALDRAEQLKHPQSIQKSILHESKLKDQRRKEACSALTEAEIAVLKRSSLIASGLFLPWSDADAQKLSEEAQKPSISLWTDPDGYLKLSDKQRARFHKWARPSEIALMRRKKGITSSLMKPVMIKAITPYSIQQKYVTDCSFIASLCICAAFERRFDRKLVTSLIHPQTPDGNPMCSPSGKYAVKLWLNGIGRQVIVDDYLPVDRFGNLLCSHTTIKGLELWVSIIEKAYMKLCKFNNFSNIICSLLSHPAQLFHSFPIQAVGMTFQVPIAVLIYSL